MAINTSALTAYVEEQNLPLIRKAVLGARTIQYLTLQTGVVGPTAINLLETTVEFGDGSACGWNANGESKLSQRKIEPANLKVNMSFCDKKLLATWAQHEVRVAAGHEQLPFEEAFVAGIIEQIGEKLDSAIWQGIEVGGKTYKGFLNLGGHTTAAKGATVYASTRAVYNAIPAAALSTSKIFMGIDKFRELAGELTEKNLYHYDPKVDEAFKMVLPGTTIDVIGVPGLNGTNKIVALNCAHSVYGTDMTGDEEVFKLWYSDDNQEFRFKTNFTEGVQVAYADEVVICDLA